MNHNTAAAQLITDNRLRTSPTSRDAIAELVAVAHPDAGVFERRRIQSAVITQLGEGDFGSFVF